MASIQEQLKHIRTANDDWYSEHHRSVKTMLILIGNYADPSRLIGELANLSRQASSESLSASTTPNSEVPPAPEPEPARTRAATVSFFSKR